MTTSGAFLRERRRAILRGLAGLGVAAAALGLGLAVASAGVVPVAVGVFAAAVLAGALYRPLDGRTPGAGCAAVPALAAFAGPAWAAVAGAAGVSLAEAVWVRGRQARPARREVLLVAAAAVRSGLALAAALAAARAAAAPFSPLAAGALALAAYAAASLAADLAVARLAGGGWRPPRLSETLPYLLVDLPSLGVGFALAATAGAAGPGVAALLAGGLALLAVEAARQEFSAFAARLRLTDLDRLRRAGRRMASPARDLAEAVDAIRAECADAVGSFWFQLDLAGAGGGTWSAGPEGRLRPGPASPEPYPPPLPGLHRRSTWRVLVRDLGEPADGAHRAADSSPAAGEPLARLRLWCDPRRLRPPQLAMLAALLPSMAASLQQAVLDREARQDALTGVFVRRVLERRLAAAFAAACETGGRLAVVLADLDHFKPINDTYGHAVGDRALAAVAAALTAHKRTPDLLARWGGEEFALLLVDVDGEAALASADRLRREVEALALEAGGARIALTVSAGVAAFPALPVRSPGELLELADEALYEAKRRGRNRCLLNSGRGRYRGVDGTEIGEADETASPAQAPRLFA